MDFSDNPDGGPVFFYCLPYSATEALVECTVFSTEIWDTLLYEQKIRGYLERRLGLFEFDIIEVEKGRIPMTNMDLARTNFPHIRSIGTAGNAVKPTTGYAFLRIQRQAEQIALQLSQTGMVAHQNILENRWHWYDELLLYLLQNHPQRSRAIFAALFDKQPYIRILRFLDEQTKWWEEILLFKDLQISWFLEAAIRNHFQLDQVGIFDNSRKKTAQYG